MNVLNEKEEKMIAVFKKRKKPEKIAGWIFIFVGVAVTMFVILLTFFNESHRLLVMADTAEISGMIVKNPRRNQLVYLCGFMLMQSMIGFYLLLFNKRIHKLVHIIDRFKANRDEPTR